MIWTCIASLLFEACVPTLFLSVILYFLFGSQLKQRHKKAINKQAATTNHPSITCTVSSTSSVDITI